MKHLKKSSLLFLLVCCMAIRTKAQVGYDYAQYDIGFGIGMNTAYGDAETTTSTKSYHFNFTYNYSPFINYIIEAQFGQLKGGDSLTTYSGRQFNNNFSAVMFKVQVQAGEIMDYSQSNMSNFFKNVYISTGVGFVVNHITDISRYSTLIPGYYTPGLNNSNEILIPAKIGYEIKFFNRFEQPSIKLDLGYQYNFVLGDELDGFQVGTKRDAYSQIVVGLKFAIGGITSYRKQITY